MPLLNSRSMSSATALQSNRAAEIQLGMMKRDVHAVSRLAARGSDAAGLAASTTKSRLVAGSGTDGDAGRVARGTIRPELSAASMRTSCGNPGCHGGWTPPWRSRRYPFFEDRWACSQRCLLEMVKMAVARELDDGVLEEVVDDTPQHRHRIPLGLVLLGQGWITHPQLRKALEMQRLKGKGRIGDWLVSECGLRSEWITRGLSVQWNCPVLTTDGFSPETMARAIPRPFIEDYGILPLRVAARRILYVGFQDHLDAASAYAVEQISGLRTECGVIGEERYRKARDQVLDCRFIEMKQAVVGDRDSLARSIERVLDQYKPIASRLVRLHRYYWLRLWQEEKGGIQAIRQIPAPNEAADFLFTIK
jgi:hypothetical protein